jgi:hypothetical protein
VSIGLNSFLSNSIATITWPSSCNIVYIDYGAFYGNQLSSLDFSGCSKLSGFGSSSTYGVFQSNYIRTVKFGSNSYITSLPDHLFYANKLISMNFTELNHLTYVGFETFHGNLLTSLDISDTLMTIIGTRSFAYNSLKTITWNSELTVINSGAFIGNSLTTLSFTGATKLTYLFGDGTYSSILLITHSLLHTLTYSLTQVTGDVFKIIVWSMSISPIVLCPTSDTAASSITKSPQLLLTNT